MDFIELKNKQGASIEARPLRVTFDEVTIVRRDDKVFTMPFEDLDEASRQAVLDYLDLGIPTVAPKKASPPPPPGGTKQDEAERPNKRAFVVIGQPQLDLSTDKRIIRAAVYSEPANDYVDAQHGELNLRQVILMRDGAARMGVELTCQRLEGMPLSRSNFEMVLLIDLDNDLSTGMADEANLGVDIIITLIHKGLRDWYYSSKAMSAIGNETTVLLDKIYVGPNIIRFIIDSEAFDQEHAVRLIMETRRGGEEATVDRFPNKGSLPFSFEHEIYREATENW